MSLYNRHKVDYYRNAKQEDYDLVYLNYALNRLKRLRDGVRHSLAVIDLLNAADKRKRPHTTNWYGNYRLYIKYKWEVFL